MTNTLEDEVLDFVKEMNQAWALDANVEGLKDYFHPDMVAIAPTEQQILSGRDSCLGVWRRFVNMARIHSWEELENKVTVFGNTAVVTYYWVVSFDIDGKTSNQQGRDMFVLVREKGRWWAVADHFSPFPNDLKL